MSCPPSRQPQPLAGVERAGSSPWEKRMTDGKEAKLPERSEEAENLAREGLDEIKHGDKEE